MKSNTLGLDIGGQSIKTVWLDKEKDVLSLEACVSIPTPIHGMMSESLQDQDSIANVIHKMMADANITAKSVHLALGDTQAYTKILDMPALSDKELSSAIYWEAEQYLPIPISEVTLDTKVLHRDESTSTNARMQLLLAAARVDVVKRYQSILEIAGLRVESVEPDILSVIRPFAQSSLLPATIIMNIGAHSTEIVILQSGILVFSYTVPLGGVAMNRAISTDFGISIQQAEEFKKVYGLADKNLGSKIGQVIEPILLSLFNEVQKANSFYREKYESSSVIRQIQLTGGSAKLPGIDLYFAQKSGIETVIANPWSLLSIKNVPANILERGPEYHVAIGLALREYE